MTAMESLRPYMAPAAIVAAVVGGLHLGLVEPEIARAKDAEVRLAAVSSPDAEADPTLVTEASLADLSARLQDHEPWIEAAAVPLPDASQLFASAGELAGVHEIQLRKFSPSDAVSPTEGVMARDVQLELAGDLASVRDMLHDFESGLAYSVLSELSVRPGPSREAADMTVFVVARYRMHSFTAPETSQDGATPSRVSP